MRIPNTSRYAPPGGTEVEADVTFSEAATSARECRVYLDLDRPLTGVLFAEELETDPDAMEAWLAKHWIPADAHIKRQYRRGESTEIELTVSEAETSRIKYPNETVRLTSAQARRTAGEVIARIVARP